MGDGQNGGKVKLNSSNEFDSPHTFGDYHWDTNHTLRGIMDGRTYNNYKQSFYYWGGSGGPYYNKDQEITIEWYTPDTPSTFTANYKNIYEVTFRNYFPGESGYPGNIKVDGNTENSPHITEVEHGNNIQGEALNQTYNGVNYTFDEWSDSYQYATRTETPSGTETYTAEFTGKPVSMYYYNLVIVGDPGDPVGLDWD